MSAGVPAGRARPPRTVRGSLASIVLAIEFLVVILSSLVVFGLKDLPAGEALGGGAVLLVLIALAGASARRPAGIVLGWVVQVLFVASGHFDIVVGVVGLIFGALWTYCMIVGGRIDRREAQA